MLTLLGEMQVEKRMAQMRRVVVVKKKRKKKEMRMAKWMGCRVKVLSCQRQEGQSAESIAGFHFHFRVMRCLTLTEFGRKKKRKLKKRMTMEI